MVSVARPVMCRATSSQRPPTSMPGDFHPRQQRHGADLVLRIARLDAPDMVVIGIEHRGFIAERDMKQRLVPPIVGVHERVEIDPGLLRLAEKRDAFPHPACPQHHMRQRMLRPRLLGLELSALRRAKSR